MKQIEMTVKRTNGTTERKTFYRVSRWISVRTNEHPTPRNGMWDYVMDGYGFHPYQDAFDPSEGLFLDYFKYDGQNYALERFWGCGNYFHGIPEYFYTEDGETHYLTGVDMDGDLYNPIYIEGDGTGERVRVYIEA